MTYVIRHSTGALFAYASTPEEAEVQRAGRVASYEGNAREALRGACNAKPGSDCRMAWFNKKLSRFQLYRQMANDGRAAQVEVQ